MEFGKFLARLRKEKGVMQKDVANYLNVTISTISNYETGIHMPDINSLARLADFFDVSTDYLLRRTGYRVNMSTLNTPLETDFTLGDFMYATLELDSHDRSALLDYYKLLSLRSSVEKNETKHSP